MEKLAIIVHLLCERFVCAEFIWILLILLFCYFAYVLCYFGQHRIFIIVDLPYLVYSNADISYRVLSNAVLCWGRMSESRSY